MTKPVIGFTTTCKQFVLLHFLVRVSIWLAGGKAVRLSSKNPKYDRELDGLIICGGTDVFQKGPDFLPKEGYSYDRPRDALELNWLAWTEKNQIPVLGICRGAQIMNAYRGGTLHMDVSKAYEGAKYPTSFFARVCYRKTMQVHEDTLLATLIGHGPARVNSMHQQSVDKMGDGLIQSACEDNGVVQAIEDPSKDFYLGVQFHPEALIYQSKYLGIFKKLIAASR